MPDAKPAALAAIKADHANFARALKVLDREVERFAHGGDPDFELIEMAVDYLGDYPDLCHHPKEDLVQDRLKARAPEVAEIMGDLRDEHRRLAELVKKFTKVVDKVLLDTEMPRDEFTEAATEFLDFFRSHMLMEELRFLPAAERALTPEDWAEIDAALVAAADPVLTADDSAPLKRLAREIEEIAAEAGG